MVHSSLAFRSRGIVFGTFALAWMASACAAGGASGDDDATATAQDAQASVDSAQRDARPDVAASASDVPGNDAQAPVDAHAPIDARSDAPPAAHDAATDAHAPAPPPCHSGDRAEWSGAIPNTT